LDHKIDFPYFFLFHIFLLYIFVLLLFVVLITSTKNLEDLVLNVPSLLILSKDLNIIEAERMILTFNSNLTLNDDQDAIVLHGLAIDLILLPLRTVEAKGQHLWHNVVKSHILATAPGNEGVVTIDTSKLIAVTGEDVVVLVDEATSTLLEGGHVVVVRHFLDDDEKVYFYFSFSFF